MSRRMENTDDDDVGRVSSRRALTSIEEIQHGRSLPLRRTNQRRRHRKDYSLSLALANVKPMVQSAAYSLTSIVPTVPVLGTSSSTTGCVNGYKHGASAGGQGFEVCDGWRLTPKYSGGMEALTKQGLTLRVDCESSPSGHRDIGETGHCRLGITYNTLPPKPGNFALPPTFLPTHTEAAQPVSCQAVSQSAIASSPAAP
ncbi:hypothetical protein F5I97DRAFT_1826504 [Phlebopus sp. FC_14]|nr:hypothetical protein F5I97DRAFT_1826504 [Phlebopus sp. FC_14]